MYGSALDLDLVAVQVRQTKMPMINAHNGTCLRCFGGDVPDDLLRCLSCFDLL